jgi:hypothetical protein
MSYAEKLKQNTSNPIRQIQQAQTTPRHIVAVYPAENSKIAISEETKRALVSSIVPAKEKLEIKILKIINKNESSLKHKPVSRMANMPSKRQHNN